MNLNNAVSGLISAVNPPIPAIWRRANGYTTGPSGTREPAYNAGVSLNLQVQALTGKDLKLADSLNVQGVLRSVYAPVNLQGVSRATNQGGDLLQFADPEFGLQWWLVTVVFETWTGQWCKVGVTLQTAGPPTGPPP